MEKKSPKISRFLLKRLDLKPVNKRAKRLEKTTLKHAHTFIVARFTNLRSIRRHIIGWLLLISLLIGLSSLQLGFGVFSTGSMKATEGGTYAEGTVDSITTLNPLFATTQAELSANKLIFSSLLKYDTQGVLQPDLAESWHASKSSTEYTFVLRPHLKWHDGKKLTSEDIVATVKAMQDPNVGALAQVSWKDIKVKALDERRVVFTLPGSYAPFASAMTFAILPHHILEKIKPENLQESSFSKNPIGSGPFKFVDLNSVDITNGKDALQLTAFDDYWNGEPRVSRFFLYTYSRPENLLKGLTSNEINAANDLGSRDSKKLDTTEFNQYKIPLNSGVYALFRTDSKQLKEVKVRQALVQSVDLADLRRQLEVKALDSPIINSQLPLASKVKQLPYNKAAAEKLLTDAGWIKNKKNGLLEKNGVPLEVNVVTVDARSYRTIISILSEQWADLGIKLHTQIVDPESVQQSVLRPRAYDVLIYELELGGDADSYAYWHSSQSVGAGLNFANYSSPISDDALSTARVRSDIKLRDAKYTTFAKRWVADAPALSLYQPTLNYVGARNIISLNNKDRLPTPSDRFGSVNQWVVQEKFTPNSP